MSNKREVQGLEVVAYLAKTVANGRTTIRAALGPVSITGLRYSTEDQSATIESDEPLIRKSDADACIAELERLKRGRIDALETEIAAFRAERDQLRAELAALKAQEPVAYPVVVGWYQPEDSFHITANPNICANWHREGLKVAPVYATPFAKQEAVSDAARDVMAERQRQISAEGWTPEHDNEHSDGSMALAASCYACASTGRDDSMRDWPWSQEWFKPSTPRRSLVKAAALILAEIDRIDRAAQGEKP